MTEFNDNGAEFLEKKPTAKGLIIEVPFAEKDQAKALGARWNPEAKKWYIPEGVEQDQFRKWIKS